MKNTNRPPIIHNSFENGIPGPFARGAALMSALALLAAAPSASADLTSSAIHNGGDVIVTFTAGSGTWTVPTGVTSVQVLVVGGGGGGGGGTGGGNGGGGGGAGGLIYNAGYTVIGGTGYTVMIGTGGAQGGANGSSGSNSVFDALTAIGGGGGGGTGASGVAGGSGGGVGRGTPNTVAAASGTAGQGNNGGIGGSATGAWASGGGGGGAGAAGANGSASGSGSDAANGGNGGAGVANSISGTSVTYAGGGGGAAQGKAGGTGGAGGGGGGAGTGNASGGTANTGGGGGGGHGGLVKAGGGGGSGVVIVRYPYSGPVPNTFSWNNSGSAAWSGVANWNDNLGGTGVWGPDAAGQAGYTLNFNTTGTYTATNDLNSGFLLNQLNFGGSTVTLAGNSLEFTGTSPQVNQNSSAAVTVGNALVLDSDTTIGGSGTGTLTLDGAITGTGGLTKTGNGTLAVSSSNTYSGATNVNGGTLNLLPKPATGQTLWLDAQTIPGNNGDTLSAWTASTGTSLGLDGSGVTLATNVAAFNNMKTVHFNGNGVLYNSTNYQSRPYTIFYVGRIGNAASHGRLVSGRNNNWIMGYYGPSAMDSLFLNGSPASLSPTAADTNVYIWALTSNPDGTVTLNRYTAATNPYTMTWTGQTGVGPNGMQIGGAWSNTLERSAGDVAELLYYPSVLTGADYNNTLGYLRARYFNSGSGGSGSLPANSAISIAAGATLDVSGINAFTLGGGNSLTASGTGATPATIKGGTTVSLGSQALTLNFTPTGFAGDTANPALTLSQGALTLNGAITVNIGGSTPLGAGTYRLIWQTGGSISGAPTLAATTGPGGNNGLASGLLASLQVSGGQVNLVAASAFTTPTVAVTRHSGTVDSTTYGDSLAFDVAVTPNSPTPPTGLVTLTDGGAAGTPIGTFLLVSGDNGTCSIAPALNALTAGSHTNIVAVYAGDVNFSSGTSLPLSTQTVARKELTIADAVALNKIRDGGTTATLGGTLSGVVSGDTVTSILSGYFASAAVGIHNVTSTSSIDTASQVNYTLTQPTGLAAEILAAGIWTGATDSHWNAFTPGNWLFGAIPINWQNVTFDANTVNGTVNIEWYKGTGAFSLNSGLATDIAFDNGGQPIIQSANNLNGSGSWINIDPDSRNPTINSSYLIWDGSATWNIGTGRALTINGAISSTYGITMTGPGTAVLTGANTYTGTTAVNAGVLNIRNATALGTTAAGTSVTSGAALQIQNNITVGTESLTLKGTGISADGALRNISGNNVWHGTVTLGSSGVRINSDADSLTFNTAANSITGTNTNLTLGGAGNGTVAGTITTGSGTLTKDGNGIWTLSGANTYTGATTVSQGTLALIGGSQASPITVNSGASLGFTLGSPTSSTSTFDLSAGTIKITGTPALASYTLIASSIAITGTPVLDASISGYSLLVEGGTILKLIKSGYASWATDQGLTGTAGDGSGTDPAFDADPNKDGIQNGMAWILGAGALGAPAATLLKLPAVSRDGTGAMILTFDRLGSSDASAPLVVQYSDNLGATPWTDLAVGARGGTDGNVTIAVATGGGLAGTAYDRITVTIPATYMAAHPKTFARLTANPTP